MDYTAKRSTRGRPRKGEDYILPPEPPKITKFVKEYKEHTGHRSVWTYDLDKNPYGPISVEEFYPKGSEEARTEDVVDTHLPKSQRKYWNPDTNKYVSYTRAYQLGLLKD